MADETLAFEPGTRWQYSNTGMLIAGAVLEKAAGRDYFDLVRETLYGPAGMKDTDCYDIDLVVPNLAIGYSREARARRGSGARTPSSTSSGAGPRAAATPRPPTSWPSPRPCAWAAGEAGEPGAAVEPQARARPAIRLRLRPREGPGGRIVGHSGGFPGISSNLDIFRDSGFVAVVLSNQDGGSEAVVDIIRTLVGRIR